MFTTHYNASLIITESTITGILLYKKNRKWQLIQTWRYTSFIDPCNPCPSNDFIQSLLTIGNSLSHHRCSVRLMVTQLPISHAKLPCSDNMINQSTIEKIAIHYAIQQSGRQQEELSIDYRLTNQCKTLSVIWCDRKVIMQWQTILKKCGLVLDIFESEITLTEQCKFRYPIIKNHQNQHKFNWIDFNITPSKQAILIDENIIFAIGLATRGPDTLCC